MTPQEVLQADWQEVGHSPHPPVFTLSCKLPDVMVWILVMGISSLCFVVFLILPEGCKNVNAVLGKLNMAQ